MKVSKYLILILFLIVIHKVGKSQSDFGMWNTFNLEKQFSKKISLEVDEELRFKNNISRLNLLYTNLGINFRPVKGLKFSILYRLTEKYTDVHQFNFRNRLMADAAYKYHLSNFIIGYRARIQSEIINNKSTSPEWFWRNKFEVKYNLGRFAPYLGTELRYQLKVPKHPETDMGWHQVRFFLGLDYKINKNNEVGAYFLVQNDFYTLDPNDLNILGFQYSMTIPYHKKQNTENSAP
jgi:hypothetical protein